MSRTVGIDHVHLHVGDVERALRFYRSVLGAEEAFRVGDSLVFLQLSAHGIIALDGRPEEDRSPQHVGLSVEHEDLDAAVREVERAGGRLVERGEHAPGIAYAYVEDPDGNVLEL